MYRSRRVFDTFVPFSLSSHVLEDFLLKGPTNLVSFLVHAVDKMLLGPQANRIKTIQKSAQASRRMLA